MAHDYHRLKRWGQWLINSSHGNKLIAAELELINSLLDRYYGRHAVLIGVSQQTKLLDLSHISIKTLVTPIMGEKISASINLIDCKLNELPFLSGSADLVILPHTQEFIAYPRHLVAEACRIVKPEGLIVIAGFNPYSLWGLAHGFSTYKDTVVPWRGELIRPTTVINWLRLADFMVESKNTTVFGLPWRSRIHFIANFMEHLLAKWLVSLGGVYILVARAKVIPMTPIRLHWKQKVGNFKLTVPVSGYGIRSCR